MIIVSAAALAVGLTAPAEALLAIINGSFLAGLFLLVLGGFALVVRSGFFSAACLPAATNSSMRGARGSCSQQAA
jgi:hypothetical protein